MKPLIVALTGASGAAYGIRVVQALAEQGHSVAVVISEAARLVLREELENCPSGFSRPQDIEAIFGPVVHGKIEVYSPKDFTAPIASGSYPCAGMVIVPCSMGTLGALAAGLSQNLIHRAADCVIKEGRRLVIVPRETPLHAIHLENMLKLARLGVRIVPAMPGFYSGAKTLPDIIDFMAGKVLDQFDIPHGLYPRWVGPAVNLKNSRPEASIPVKGKEAYS